MHVSKPESLKWYIGNLLITWQSFDPSITHSIDQSITHSLTRSFDQSINQSVNQSINQSISQSINHIIHYLAIQIGYSTTSLNLQSTITTLAINHSTNQSITQLIINSLKNVRLIITVHTHDERSWKNLGHVEQIDAN